MRHWPQGAVWYLCRGDPTTLGKRSQVEAKATKQILEEWEIPIKWCASTRQLADALTKEDGTAQEKLKQFLANGKWKYQEDKEFVARKQLPKEDMVNLAYEQEHINDEIAWFSRSIRNRGWHIFQAKTSIKQYYDQWKLWWIGHVKFHERMPCVHRGYDPWCGYAERGSWVWLCLWPTVLQPHCCFDHLLRHARFVSKWMTSN